MDEFNSNNSNPGAPCSLPINSLFNNNWRTATGVRDYAQQNNASTLDARCELVNKQLHKQHLINNMLDNKQPTFFAANKAAFQGGHIGQQTFEDNNHLNMLANHAKHKV